MVQPVNTTPIILSRAMFITPGIAWYDRKVWVYRISLGRVQPVARCGLEPTQCAKSLEVPLWMLEASSCSTLRPVSRSRPKVRPAEAGALKPRQHRKEIDPFTARTLPSRSRNLTIFCQNS
jgi:hypothetical protein